MPDGTSVHERESLLAEIEAAAHRVESSGFAAAVMLRGEPGIGKSTLLDLATAQLGAGWSVLRLTGRALGSERPYEGAASLVRRVCALLGAADIDLHGAGLLEETAVLLTRLAAAGGVAIVVDDLHWVDAGTIDLLDYLWTEFVGAPVLWLLALRAPEAEGRAEVAHLVHRIERERRTTTIDVPRLSLGAVRAMCAAAGTAAGVDVPERTVEQIHGRSRGNPLVVDALLRAPAAAWIDGGGADPIPGYVRAAFVGQLKDLQPAERDALCIAVALDATIDEGSAESILTTLGHPPAVAHGALRALVQRGLLERAQQGSVATAHPVVGEIALDQYAGDELARVCAAILEARPGEVGVFDAGRLAETAGHAVAPELAVEVLTTAADHALGAAAVEAALRWQRVAVLQAERITSPARDATLARSLLRLASHLDGIPTEAIEVADRALAIATALGDQEVAVDAALALARARWQATGAAAADDLRRICDVADQGDGRLAARARVVALRLALVSGTDDEQVEQWADECRRVGAAQGAAQVAAAVDLLMGLRHMHRFSTDDWLRMQEQLRGGSTGLPGSLVDVMRLDQAQIVGDLAEMDRLAGEPSLPPWRRLLARFEVAFLTGRWDDAQRVVDSVGPLGRHQEVRGLAAWMAVHRGLPVSPPLDGHARLAAAYGAHLRGEAVTVAEAGEHERYVAMQESRVRTVMAELQLAGGLADEFHHTLARIEAMAVRGGRMDATSERLRGLEARAQGDLSAARSHLLRAMQIHDTLGITFEARRCEVEALTLAEPDEVEAARLGELAAWFEDIGAVPWAGRARSGAAALPGTPSARGANTLTRREMEIARLVAEGKSNAQIAADLFLSVRTVTSHLDHAYTKLGVGSRAALAVYVVELDRNT